MEVLDNLKFSCLKIAVNGVCKVCKDFDIGYIDLLQSMREIGIRH
jgi:hypothetical protein